MAVMQCRTNSFLPQWTAREFSLGDLFSLAQGLGERGGGGCVGGGKRPNENDMNSRGWISKLWSFVTVAGTRMNRLVDIIITPLFYHYLAVGKGKQMLKKKPFWSCASHFQQLSTFTSV